MRNEDWMATNGLGYTHLLGEWREGKCGGMPRFAFGVLCIYVYVPG